MVGDDSIVAKLSFFGFIARLLQPYLIKCQTDKPMQPFPIKDIERMQQVLLQLAVKPILRDKCVSFVDLLKSFLLQIYLRSLKIFYR